ncbi:MULTISPECIES: ATP-binding cassette domain-containing protein [Mesotoga]|uniref:ABC-type multidrug transport system, ATPase component n=2 Tax=Mesotoga TaxID=1184396 RepID=I2F4S5_9BACT|nr:MULTISPECIES: ATP-binding cassette domain-containing protein [Mesotoga]MCP5457367.1 ATP-binding cassette domain-containing protein [Thermotogota bacterium]CCU83563.1 AAA ATPase [Mesotoga infera]AFK06928.1 ABC-type multidrug transport system, ATPase component [Mesotoga prima MesG1.Ag.4.2]MCB1222530.1 ATP-binding cassette domain-containing protein [Mesotoga sp.]MCP5460733.1 ATP-binding cassette domain-containing protein [Thermotogota bacterium]
MIETALSLKGFTLLVEGRKMLDGITFDVPKGSIALLQGARGAGKSALLRSFIHLNEELFDRVSYTGSIKLFGEDIDSLERKSVRKRVAYVDTTFLEAMSNFTLIEFFRFLKGKRFEFEDFAESELDLFHELDLLDLLSLKAETSLKTIPLFKRLSLLVFSTLIRHPEIIILDNILDHLDDDACTEVKNVLLDTRNGVTMIISSRFVLRLLDISDLLIVLKNGKISYVGSPEVFVLNNR